MAHTNKTHTVLTVDGTLNDRNEVNFTTTGMQQKTTAEIIGAPDYNGLKELYVARAHICLNRNRHKKNPHFKHTLFPSR